MIFISAIAKVLLYNSAILILKYIPGGRLKNY